MRANWFRQIGPAGLAGRVGGPQPDRDFVAALDQPCFTSLLLLHDFAEQILATLDQIGTTGPRRRAGPQTLFRFLFAKGIQLALDFLQSM